MEEEEEAGEALAVEVDMEAVGDLEADVAVAVEDTEEAATEVVVTEEAAMVVVAVATTAAELGISLGSVLTAVIVDFIQLFGGGFEKKKEEKAKKKAVSFWGLCLSF